MQDHIKTTISRHRRKHSDRVEWFLQSKSHRAELWLRLLLQRFRRNVFSFRNWRTTSDPDTLINNQYILFNDISSQNMHMTKIHPLTKAPTMNNFYTKEITPNKTIYGNPRINNQSSEKQISPLLSNSAYGRTLM